MSNGATVGAILAALASVAIIGGAIYYLRKWMYHRCVQLLNWLKLLSHLRSAQALDEEAGYLNGREKRMFVRRPQPFESRFRPDGMVNMIDMQAIRRRQFMENAGWRWLRSIGRGTHWRWDGGSNRHRPRTRVGPHDIEPAVGNVDLGRLPPASMAPSESTIRDLSLRGPPIVPRAIFEPPIADLGFKRPPVFPRARFESVYGSRNTKIDPFMAGGPSRGLWPEIPRPRHHFAVGDVRNHQLRHVSRFQVPPEMSPRVFSRMDSRENQWPLHGYPFEGTGFGTGPPFGNFTGRPLGRTGGDFPDSFRPLGRSQSLPISRKNPFLFPKGGSGMMPFDMPSAGQRQRSSGHFPSAGSRMMPFDVPSTGQRRRSLGPMPGDRTRDMRPFSMRPPYPSFSPNYPEPLQNIQRNGADNPDLRSRYSDVEQAGDVRTIVSNNEQTNQPKLARMDFIHICDEYPPIVAEAVGRKATSVATSTIPSNVTSTSVTSSSRSSDQTSRALTSIATTRNQREPHLKSRRRSHQPRQVKNKHVPDKQDVQKPPIRLEHYAKNADGHRGGDTARPSLTDNRPASSRTRRHVSYKTQPSGDGGEISSNGTSQRQTTYSYLESPITANNDISQSLSRSWSESDRHEDTESPQSNRVIITPDSRIETLSPTITLPRNDIEPPTNLPIFVRPVIPLPTSSLLTSTSSSSETLPSLPLASHTPPARRQSSPRPYVSSNPAQAGSQLSSQNPPAPNPPNLGPQITPLPESPPLPHGHVYTLPSSTTSAQGGQGDINDPKAVFSVHTDKPIPPDFPQPPQQLALMAPQPHTARIPTPQPQPQPQPNSPKPPNQPQDQQSHAPPQQPTPPPPAPLFHPTQQNQPQLDPPDDDQKRHQRADHQDSQNLKAENGITQGVPPPPPTLLGTKHSPSPPTSGISTLNLSHAAPFNRPEAAARNRASSRRNERGKANEVMKNYEAGECQWKLSRCSQIATPYVGRDPLTEFGILRHSSFL
ncbi:unnamed protein product [Periconia digitata]|uniref:Uncharacterized protein n=1 Tax=Periconia digitata TaxID=1303443 RepID=A0A9W4UGC2_9PLEO|nr:unnamed protein product [Periconia digitata]